jgi:hypothetical protein
MKPKKYIHIAAFFSLLMLSGGNIAFEPECEYFCIDYISESEFYFDSSGCNFCESGFVVITAEMAQECVPVSFEYAWVGLIDLDDELNQDWYQVWCDENASTEPREAYLYLTMSDVLYIYQAGVESYPPETPGAITGSTSLCPGATSSFYITPVPDATEYEWTVPQGWTINSGQGDTLISLTAGQASGYGYSISVVAINDDGESAPSELSNITIYYPISISAQPVSLVRNPGSSVTFSVSATGSGLNYQWQKDEEDISGATSSSCTIQNITTANNGNYRVRASNSCNTTGIFSREAILVVDDIVSPDTSHNYIAVFEPVVEIQDESLILATSLTRTNIQYFDGLGRLSQSISVKSNNGKDLVSHIEYDQFGRESVSFLPFPVFDNKGLFVDSVNYKQPEYYGSVYPGDSAFAQTIYENSPLNRVLKQGAPGAAWQPSGIANDHTVKFDYQTNSQEEALIWKIDNLGRCVNTGGEDIDDRFFYFANALYKSVTKDENWSSSDGLLHTTEEFRNMLNQVVLKRTYVAGSTSIDTLDTYYVYDDFGLSAICPLT